MTPPSPPYYAVIFSSLKTDNNDGYDEWNNRLFELVKNMDGYLGHESYRREDKQGVTISYWRDLESLRKWKNETLHKKAQEM
ncbi:MAG TPA: antibiotic biosynthesis monooxygenase, partial [Chitinophagales bacterium]|nr:antibiotic biosynthesis monooxygenase [Chitinophagales bacterium]